MIQAPREAAQDLSPESAAEIEAELGRRYSSILQGPRPLDLPSLGTPQGTGDAAGLALLSESTAVLRAKHVEFLHSSHQALSHVRAPPPPPPLSPLL